MKLDKPYCAGGTYYKTLDEAVAAAERACAAGGVPINVFLVIKQARRTTPPIVTEDVELEK